VIITEGYVYVIIPYRENKKERREQAYNQAEELEIQLLKARQDS
jgi:hypothetical protein